MNCESRRYCYGERARESYLIYNFSPLLLSNNRYTTVPRSSA